MEPKLGAWCAGKENRMCTGTWKYLAARELDGVKHGIESRFQNPRTWSPRTFLAKGLSLHALVFGTCPCPYPL